MVEYQKKWAKENSICFTYGQSSTVVEKCRQKITQQLRKAENALQEFEEQSLRPWILDCNQQ